MLAYLLIIVVAFLIVASSLIRLVGEYLFTQKIREEQRIAETLAGNLTEALINFDAEALYSEAIQAARQNGGRVMVLDVNGVTLTDSESQYNGHLMQYREVLIALTELRGAYGFYGIDRTGLAEWFGILAEPDQAQAVGVYTAPMLHSNNVYGVLMYFTMSADVISGLSQIQRQIMIWLLLVMVAVAMLSFFVISRMVNRPIEELNQGIARMTQGDLSSRISVRGRNEFAQLAEAFNSMSERLEALDKARNQFVSNASHELKTPLSTIKLLIETLLYQDEINPEMQKEFLTDVNLEIDRLNLIISDLLTLVGIDSGNIKLRLSTVKLHDLVEDTARRLAPLAQHKEIHLETLINDEISTTADLMKIQQAIYNLVDNSIKYTSAGGAVRVELTRVGRKALIRVSDTGMGIPRADVIHVFDRFYRVDRARSRETGGTGLGLTIVKQNVLMHNGSVTVASEEGVGSTFTIELPIENV